MSSADEHHSFFFQAEDGIRGADVTGVQTCALPILSAISDAARNGLKIKEAVLYCTTFPCHICAKHIIAAGIRRVVYIRSEERRVGKECRSRLSSIRCKIIK